MTTATLQSSIRIGSGTTGLSSVLAELGRAYRRWLDARRNSELAAQLNDEQLADVGLDRSVLTVNRPVINIPVGTMDALMSMR